MQKIAEDLPAGFPAIDAHPMLKSVERGRTAQVTCQARGEPRPKVMWLRDLMPVDIRANSRYTVSTLGNPGQWRKTFHIDRRRRLSLFLPLFSTFFNLEQCVGVVRKGDEKDGYFVVMLTKFGIPRHQTPIWTNGLIVSYDQLFESSHFQRDYRYNQLIYSFPLISFRTNARISSRPWREFFYR